MEHQLSDAGLSIESVPEFQYWKWWLLDGNLIDE
jgi:hypothetical protein